MIQIGTKYTLNEGEQIIAQAIAKLRHKNNRANQIQNAKRGNQSDELTDLNGIASEFAFCKLFNIYPDLSISIRSATKETDQGDATLNTGEIVDIKTTTYQNGKLIAVPWKKKKSNLFALMVGSFPTYTFKGFMKSEELLREDRLGDLGHGLTFIAEQTELKELTAL